MINKQTVDAKLRDIKKYYKEKQMNKTIKQILIVVCLVGILVLPYFVFAETAALEKLKSVGNTGGYADATETSFAEILGTVVKGFLSLLGIIFIILIILSGYNWMTASGNEEKVTKAKETLLRAVIGLVIVMGSYAIWIFILNYI